MTNGFVYHSSWYRDGCQKMKERKKPSMQVHKVSKLQKYKWEAKALKTVLFLSFHNIQLFSDCLS